MKTLQMFFGVGVAVALLGVNVAMAEFRHVSLDRGVEFTPTFETADGTVTMPTFSFCDASKLGHPTEDAQSTCAITPGGIAAGLLMELPVLPPAVAPRHEVAQPLAYSPGTLPEQRPYNEPRLPYSRPPAPMPTPQSPDELPPIEGGEIPEPATLLIVGLGVAGVAMARRKGWKA